MRIIKQYFQKIAFGHLERIGAVCLAVMLIGLSSCSSHSSSTSTIPPQTTPAFTEFGNVYARIFVLANFEGYQQTAAYPIEFKMIPISVTWMGTIFNGELKGAGGGGDTTYSVHGSLSEDGTWVESMIFSRTVIHPGGYSWDFFRITLKNVPLTPTQDEQGNDQAVCNKVSSDVQRYVTKVEYNTVPSGFTYVSNDWNSTDCLASLDIAFGVGPGSQPEDTSQQNQGGGGGMM